MTPTLYARRLVRRSNLAAATACAGYLAAILTGCARAHAAALTDDCAIPTTEGATVYAMMWFVGGCLVATALSLALTARRRPAEHDPFADERGWM